MNFFSKMTLALVAVALSTTLAIAQAILPTSWNFDVAAPQGWSESLGSGNTRYAGGQAGQACRLDATGEFVLVEFAEEPGAVSYYVKGQNSGGSWLGTFTIQESVDGTPGSFTTLRSFTDSELPTAAFTLFTDAPASTSRFIRFFYAIKVSGHNFALDEVSVNIPVASPEQEINVVQGLNNVPSGFTYSIGNASSTDFSIQNLGLVNQLSILNITISGADAAQFSLVSIPVSVDALSSEALTVLFDGVGSGSKFCTLTIFSNDASESEYIVNLYAIAGDFASEPAAQATGLNFPNLVSWDFNVAFGAGNPVAERYLVLRKKGSAVSETPQDGATYVKGEWIGNSQVVYLGEPGMFNARSIEVSTEYHFALFAMNGPEGFENYLTSAPLTGIATTPTPNTGTTYNAVDRTSPAFVNQVIAAMNPSNYFQVFYSNYISTLINTFYVKDTAVAGLSLNAVECQYSGVNYTYQSGFAFSGGGDGTLSREHTYPQSWMPTFFDTGFDDSPEVSDLHNLIPVLQVECNAVRSNYPYGEVVSPTSTFEETAIGDNAIGQQVYEPRNGIKGDAARAIMYHATKNFTSINDFSLPEQISIVIPYGQDEYLLKSWHFNDLPDNMEMAKNDYIRTQQNNRNAFIDSVLFPCFIRFSNMTKWAPQLIASGNTLIAVDLGIDYTWTLNGIEIEGANSNEYEATEDGNYSVLVRQFEQCPAFESVILPVDVDAVGEVEKNPFEISIYPNPTNGPARLSVLSSQGGSVQVRLFDTAGRAVKTSTHFMVRGENIIDLNLDLPAGIYTAEVVQGTTKRVTRVSVN